MTDRLMSPGKTNENSQPDGLRRLVPALEKVSLLIRLAFYVI